MRSSPFDEVWRGLANNILVWRPHPCSVRKPVVRRVLRPVANVEVTVMIGLHHVHMKRPVPPVVTSVSVAATAAIGACTWCSSSCIVAVQSCSGGVRTPVIFAAIRFAGPVQSAFSLIGPAVKVVVHIVHGQLQRLFALWHLLEPVESPSTDVALVNDILVVTTRVVRVSIRLVHHV